MAKSKALSQELHEVIIDRGMAYRKLPQQRMIRISTIRAITRRWKEHDPTADLSKKWRPHSIK